MTEPVMTRICPKSSDDTTEAQKNHRNTEGTSTGSSLCLCGILCLCGVNHSFGMNSKMRRLRDPRTARLHPHIFPDALSPLLSQRGQALLELSLFGILIIGLLGLLIQYGMKHEVTQQVMMDAFRRAYAGNTSVMVVKDRHITSPTTPFAIGATAPASSSARIIRLWDSDQSPSSSQTIRVNDWEKTYATSQFPDSKSGLQPGNVKHTDVTTELAKTEGAAGVTNADTLH